MKIDIYDDLMNEYILTAYIMYDSDNMHDYTYCSHDRCGHGSFVTKYSDDDTYKIDLIINMLEKIKRSL
jgi:hypothetical protein